MAIGRVQNKGNSVGNGMDVWSWVAHGNQTG